jgi:hypothetical protein
MAYIVKVKNEDHRAATYEAVRTNHPDIWDYAGGNPEFALWLCLVHRAIAKRTDGGFGLMDLDDWCARDAWESDLSPREGALEALENDDIGSMLLLEL